MEDKQAASCNSLLERRLRSIEQQLARIESSLTQMKPRTGIRRIPILGRFFTPRIWRYEQYSPRRLRIDDRYVAEKIPDNPLRFAIVTPTLNQVKFVKATIDSVLQQNYPNLAYFVQDGGSVDGTANILQTFDNRIEWRSETDSGQGDAINRGFERVDGDVMAYLNSDDVLLPGTLAYVARYFLENPEVDIVYGHRIYIDIDGFEIGRCVLPPHDAEALKWADYVPQETLFWRRRVWATVGPMDKSFEFALDWEFLLRAQKAGFRFTRLPRFLACFRVHDDQKSARLTQIGQKEMSRLRAEYLSQPPGIFEIQQALKGYLLHQVLFDVMYRTGLLRY
jgi:glycosyltransferase involved in cell wall biosynthesis